MPRGKLALGQNSTEITSSDKSNSAAMFLRIQTDIYSAELTLSPRLCQAADNCNNSYFYKTIMIILIMIIYIIHNHSNDTSLRPKTIKIQIDIETSLEPIVIKTTRI